MKLTIYDVKGSKKGEKEMPSQFGESVRIDLITRAVLSLLSKARVAYGSKETAGKRHSAHLTKRRRKYRGSYGYGISRVSRKILSRSGTRFSWVGAVAPGTVGGRRAHPPKPYKNFGEEINVKERRKAIRSAISATLNKDLVISRGHKISDNYPFILSSDFETLKKTKEIKEAFEKLNLKDELERVKEKKIRAGRGKMRNRKYKRKVGPLLVVAHTCPLMKSSQNLNIDVVDVRSLNANRLAPGTVPGRLTLFTETAIDILNKEKLFM